MLLNIKTGRNGVTQRDLSEIVILFSSIYKLEEDGVEYLFTDRHAYLNAANFSKNPDDLNEYIDWRLLQRRDFKRDNNDLGKFERYQAEALIYRHLPIEELRGIVCYDEETAAFLNEAVGVRELDLRVAVRRGWYL